MGNIWHKNFQCPSKSLKVRQKHQNELELLSPEFVLIIGQIMWQIESIQQKPLPLDQPRVQLFNYLPLQPATHTHILLVKFPQFNARCSHLTGYKITITHFTVF